jgi:formate-dependent nitrite reductase cytochrome c552 subunit
MHPVGKSWVKGHEHVAEKNPAQCKVCHGSNYRGDNLSKAWTDRSFSTKWGQKNFAKGHKVSCYDCHNGPKGH